MKIKFLGLILCLCFSFLATNMIAQSSKADCKKTCSKSYNISVSTSESNDNSNYTVGYSNQYTDNVEKFLIKKLGRNYSTELGLKRWKRDYLVVSSNGHVSITYQGTNESKRDEAKKLFNDVITEIKSNKG